VRTRGEPEREKALLFPGERSATDGRAGAAKERAVAPGTAKILLLTKLLLEHVFLKPNARPRMAELGPQKNASCAMDGEGRLASEAGTAQRCKNSRRNNTPPLKNFDCKWLQWSLKNLQNFYQLT